MWHTTAYVANDSGLSICVWRRSSHYTHGHRHRRPLMTNSRVSGKTPTHFIRSLMIHSLGTNFSRFVPELCDVRHNVSFLFGEIRVVGVRVFFCRATLCIAPPMSWRRVCLPVRPDVCHVCVLYRNGYT